MDKKGETKRQHYVPQSILRRFSLDGKTTSILLADNGQVVPRGAINRQCYEVYFYGEDQQLEKVFADNEAQFSRILRDLESAHLDVLSDDDLLQIKFFVHYQAARTRAAVEQTKEFLRAMMAPILCQVAEKNGRPRPTPEQLRDAPLPPSFDGPTQTLLGAMKTAPAVTDLEVRFIQTDRTPGFIVGDHPVVAYNQFAEHHDVLRAYPNITALAVKGLQLFMPLSPSTTLMVYDPGVYDVDGKGRTCRAGPREVHFLNAMQYVNAWECAFFNAQRMTDDGLHRLVAARLSHPRVHSSEATTDVMELQIVGVREVLVPRSDLVVTVRRDVRVGARLGFLRVTDKNSYEDHEGPSVPIRSPEIWAFTRRYGEYVQLRLDERAPAGDLATATDSPDTST